MKIQLDLESLTTSLDIITRLAPPTSGNITFQSNGKKVKVLSVADLSRCTTLLACKVDKQGEFAIPLQALRDAVKGRKELELVYKNATLQVLSGKYHAELNTVDVIPPDEEETEDGEELKLDTQQSAWLKTALRNVNLKPTTLLSAWMPVGIKLTPKSAFVACYDSNHFSWVTSKEISGEFECVMPIETMMSVIDLFHKTSFTVKKTKSRIEIKNAIARVSLSIPSTDEILPLDDVQAKAKEASKIDGETFLFSKDQFMVFMDNARAVIGKERAEVEVTGGKAISAAIKTGQGKIATTIKGQGKGTFKVDYEYLLEGLSKAGSEIELNVVADSFISMKLASSSIIIAVNQ